MAVVVAAVAVTAMVHAADNSATPTTIPVASSAGDKWKLVWADEFDHDGAPDPAKWKYEHGFVRNNEPQYYTDRRENVRVESGMLILEARKERYQNAGVNPAAKNPRNHQAFADYTSASIITKGLFDFRYGRVEMRLELPTGASTWPAVWTLGANIGTVHWPACGEIDIMEWWGNKPKVMTSALHFQRAGIHKSVQGTTTQPAAITGFHDYAMEWTPEKIDIFYDGKMYHHEALKGIDDKDSFQLPQYFLIDFALNPRVKIEDGTLPQQFLVDYLRVYARRP